MADLFVGVTGGPGSGKSLVCQILRDLGVYTLSTDEIVHELLLSDKEVIFAVEQTFGEDVVVDQVVDRAALAKKVFSNSDLLKKLEAIVHPVVRKKVAERAQKVSGIVVVEVPLLFEANQESVYDYTVAVYADLALCRERWEKKHKKSDFERRVKRQLCNEEKAKKADFVIVNNTSIENLQTKVKNLKDALDKAKNEKI